METKEYYGGTYPSPPEPIGRWYEFECDVSAKAKVRVFADDMETAKFYCNLVDCDEYELDEINIENINHCTIYEE